MTIKELIEELSQLDPGLPVYVRSVLADYNAEADVVSVTVELKDVWDSGSRQDKEIRVCFIW